MATLEDLLREIGSRTIPEQTGQTAEEYFQEGDVGGGGLFGQYSITDPFSIAMMQDAARARALSNYLGQFEGRTPLDIMELDAPDQQAEPSELGSTESVFDMLSKIMAGTQGDISGLDPETIAAVRGAIDPNTGAQELRRIAGEILEAGGYENWLENQDVVFGDPGSVGGDDNTQTSTEIVFDDFGFPTEFVIDPTLIQLPPLLGDRDEDGDGGGGGGGGSPRGGGDAEEEQDDLTRSPPFPGDDDIYTGIPDFYTVLEDGRVITVLDPNTPLEEDQIPSWVDTETPGTYPESGPVIEEEVAEEEPRIPVTPGGRISDPSSRQPGDDVEGIDTSTDTDTGEGAGTGTGRGSGTGTGIGTGIGSGIGSGIGEGIGDGSGSDTGASRGMLSQPRFTPYTASIGYQPVQLQQIIAPPQKDYNRELEKMMKRLNTGRGMFT